MFNQGFGTAMGTRCAPLHACLTLGYHEETKLFTQELPKFFLVVECELIKEVFKRYMDDGFIFWPKHLDLKYFSTWLNNLHPAIKYTFRKAKLIQSDHPQPYQLWTLKLFYTLTKSLKLMFITKTLTRLIIFHITVYI